MKKVDLVQPQLNVLNPDQIEFLHDRSLQILSSTGLRVDSPRARQVFKKSVGVRIADDDRVFLERDLVEWAIKAAPSSIDIFDRNGEFAFRLGEENLISDYQQTSPSSNLPPQQFANLPMSQSVPRFGIGVTNLYFQDPMTEKVTPFSRKHMGLSVRLGDHLPNYDLISTVGVVQDFPPDIADLFAVLEMVANTTKPLVILISNEGLFLPALDLLESLHVDLSCHPFVIPYFNPITPLIINRSTGDKLLDAILRGLPVIYSNFSMAGMSTPITAAGTLALLNAELLAGLTLSQLARGGSPMILGSLPAFFDMKTMQDFYDPHTILMNLACAEMMAYYRIPHAGTSGSGAGWGADLLGGGLLWINHLTSCMGKVGLVPFVGGNLGSKVFSPALAVYSNEIIGQARRLAKGFSLNSDWLDLEEIERKGPGGNFLDAKLTIKLFREAYLESDIFPHLSLEKWETRGQPHAEQLLREYTNQLLTSNQPPDEHDEMIMKGEAFIKRL